VTVFFFAAARLSFFQKAGVLLCSIPVIASRLTGEARAGADWPDERWKSLTESAATRLEVTLLF
jgi:hypothetical protein